MRTAVAADLETLCRIEAEAAVAPWDRARFEDSLARHRILVLIAHGECCGFAVFRQVLDEAEVLNIAVAPAHARKGFGRRLLRAGLDLLADHVRAVHLEVRAGNVPAIALYRRAGFHRVGLRRNYYPAPQGREDAILMHLDLTPGGDAGIG
ncbi:MAG: ribosomal protein S18-alanine N-acetyltransferase [Porticoccaceae bacterium]